MTSVEAVDATGVSQAMQLPDAEGSSEHEVPPDPPPQVDDERDALKGLDEGLIPRAFQESDGNITEAARRLVIPPTALRVKLRRFQPTESAVTAAGAAAPVPGKL